MPGLRFSGQEGSLYLLNATTGDALLEGIPIASIKGNLPFELVKKDYIGEKGPTFREFADGYEIEADLEPDDVGKLVTYINLLKAKAEGDSSTEFAVQMRVSAPDNATFQVTFFDTHFEGIPLELGGRKELLKTTLKGKGSKYKVQAL